MNTVAKKDKAPPRQRYKRLVWTAAMVAKLGKHSDLELAKKFGTTSSTVAYRRNLLGIKPFVLNPEKDTSPLFTPDVVERMSSMTTAEVAEELGISTAQVIKFREKQGLSPKERRGPRSEEFVSKLGTMPDTELAERFGLSKTTVRYDRARLGIAPYVNPPKSKEAIALALESGLVDELGKALDKDLAKKYGLSMDEVSHMRHERKIPKFVTSLADDPKVQTVISSEITNRAMASTLGVSSPTITKLRRKAGFAIKTYNRRKPDMPWKAEHDALLGKEPDTRLSRRLGYTLHQVLNRRQELGIARYLKATQEPEPAAPALSDLIGHSRDSVVAKKLDMSLSAVREARVAAGVPPQPEDAWITDDLIAALKVKSPKLVGLEFGMDKNRLRLLAIALGIEPVTLQSIWTAENLALLGTMPDTEVAKKLSINLSRVTGRRMKLGIAAYDRFKKAMTQTESE